MYKDKPVAERRSVLSSETTLGDYKEHPVLCWANICLEEEKRQGNADQVYNDGVYGCWETQGESEVENGVDRSTGLAIYEQRHRPIRAPSIPKQGSPDFHPNQNKRRLRGRRQR